MQVIGNRRWVKTGIAGAGAFVERMQPLSSGIPQTEKPSSRNYKEVTTGRIWCSRPGPGHRVMCWPKEQQPRGFDTEWGGILHHLMHGIRIDHRFWKSSKFPVWDSETSYLDNRKGEARARPVTTPSCSGELCIFSFAYPLGQGFLCRQTCSLIPLRNFAREKGMNEFRVQFFSWSDKDQLIPIFISTYTWFILNHRKLFPQYYPTCTLLSYLLSKSTIFVSMLNRALSILYCLLDKV